MQGPASRRRFLALAGQGMAWLTALPLVGCGGDSDPASTDGGGGGGTVDGAGTPGTPVNSELRASTLESVRASVATLAAGNDHFDTAALIQALQGLPGLATIGQSTTVGNVWARFTDGRYLVIPNNLVPPARTLSGAARAQPLAHREQPLASGEFDMPMKLVAQQYRQLDMLGQVPISTAVDAAHLCLDWVGPDTLPQLRRMAVGRGFMLPEVQTLQPPDVGFDNGIDGLRNVSDDGVLFITGSAAQAGDDATPFTVICSGTPATEANLARHEALLSSGELVYAVALRGVDGQWQPVPCLAFGIAFAMNRDWRFPGESIAIFNLSGAPSLAEWIEPLRSVGLRHILGWQQPVSWQRLLAFGDDLIQLNLATNNLDGTLLRQPSEPRLNSYGMGETLEHLQRRGVATDGEAGDAVFYRQEFEPARMVNMLLPSIEYATVNENTLDIELVGQFGRAMDGSPLALKPGAPASAGLQANVVFGTRDSGRFDEPLLSRAADPLLDGRQPLAQPQWPGELLQTVLGRDDLARGGYLQVINGGRCSNVVPITHWDIPIQAAITIDDLRVDLTVNLRLRADVHGWRLGPEGYPRNGAPLGVLAASVHSSARYTASGSIDYYDAPTRTRTTVSWSGSGSLANEIGNFEVNGSLTLLWDSLETQLASLTVISTRALHDQLKVTEQFDVNGQLLRRSETPSTVPVSLSAAGPDLNGELKFRFDADWNLLSGNFEMLPVNVDILPTPPQRVLRTVLSWPRVTPDFAPRKDFGGT